MAVTYARTEVVNNASRWDAVNDEFAKIEAALVNALSRAGTAPNTMSSTLDMGDNDIINVGVISVDDLFIDGAQVPSLVDLAEAYAGYIAALDAAYNGYVASLNTIVTDADTQFNLYLTQAAASVTSAQTAQTAAETAQSLAEAAQVAAEAAQAAAEAAAAGVNLPSINPGDAGKYLEVNATEDGFDLVVVNRTAPAGFIDVGSHQVIRNITTDYTYKIDVDILLTNNVQATIGATGSGATYTATALDDIPAHAKGIILNVDLTASVVTGGAIASLYAGFAAQGQTIDALDTVGISMFASDANSVNGRLIPGKNYRVIVPLTTPGTILFEAKYTAQNANLSGGVRAVVEGYTY